MSKTITKARSEAGVVMVLTCDGDHGLLPRTTATFKGGWYPTLASLAVKSGWRMTSERDLCPECSGKKVAHAEQSTDF